MAKKAVERGLTVKPYIKTSLSPGSGVATKYLEQSGLTPFLEALGYVIIQMRRQECFRGFEKYSSAKKSIGLELPMSLRPIIAMLEDYFTITVPSRPQGTIRPRPQYSAPYTTVNIQSSHCAMIGPFTALHITMLDWLIDKYNDPFRTTGDRGGGWNTGRSKDRPLWLRRYSKPQRTKLRNGCLNRKISLWISTVCLIDTVHRHCIPILHTNTALYTDTVHTVYSNVGWFLRHWSTKSTYVWS